MTGVDLRPRTRGSSTYREPSPAKGPPDEFGPSGCCTVQVRSWAELGLHPVPSMSLTLSCRSDGRRIHDARPPSSLRIPFGSVIGIIVLRCYDCIAFAILWTVSHLNCGPLKL